MIGTATLITFLSCDPRIPKNLRRASFLSFQGDRDEVAARQAQAERMLWLCHTTWEGGEAVPPAEEAAHARLRQQALALLRAEVATQAQQLSCAGPAEAIAARQVLEVLRGLPVLARVHKSGNAGNLPEPERQMWQAFWQEVEGCFVRRLLADVPDETRLTSISARSSQPLPDSRQRGNWEPEVIAGLWAPSDVTPRRVHAPAGRVIPAAVHLSGRPQGSLGLEKP
jgi:hypothetical protein